MPAERVLLHVCCGPCSTHVIHALQERYSIALCFYNPNVHPEDEYRRRLVAAAEVADRSGLEVIASAYDPDTWHRAVAGMEGEKEGGVRCTTCYRIRLDWVGTVAKLEGFDAFATTLSVSPHKDSARVDEAGLAAGLHAGIPFHEADFSQGGGFQESCRLSREMGLYRQDYCGCEHSMKEDRAQGHRTQNTEHREGREGTTRSATE